MYMEDILICKKNNWFSLCTFPFPDERNSYYISSKKFVYTLFFHFIDFPILAMMVTIHLTTTKPLSGTGFDGGKGPANIRLCEKGFTTNCIIIYSWLDDPPFFPRCPPLLDEQIKRPFQLLLQPNHLVVCIVPIWNPFRPFQLPQDSELNFIVAWA